MWNRRHDCQKNIIGILLGIELILNAAALNFVAFTKFNNMNLDGHVFALFIILVAAAEAAVGLAIVIRFFKCEKVFILIALHSYKVKKGR